MTQSKVEAVTGPNKFLFHFPTFLQCCGSGSGIRPFFWPEDQGSGKKIFHPDVVEPHHFYAAPDPALDKNFDAAPLAPDPTLLYSKAKFLK
jgi:hypothetical protein